jgi:transglutaminase-like putative cysteine protease
MEETGMISSFWERLFRIRDLWFVLSLAAVICLPLTLVSLLNDTDLHLLLPITLFGMVAAWWMGQARQHKLSSGVILLGLSPLALTLYFGGTWKSLFRMVGEMVPLVEALLRMLRLHTPVDVSPLLLAREELLEKGLGFGTRLVVWVSGFMRGVQVEDPLLRTWFWCLVLWLAAVWAGWQMHRRERILAGILPTTLLLAFIVDFSGEKVELLLVHLGLILFLLGLAKFTEQKSHWDSSKTDYAESTVLETFLAIILLTTVLMSFSFFASTVSVKELMDKLNDRRAPSTQTQGESLGLEPVKGNAGLTGLKSGLPRSHLINSGPELSHQLVMTISTGELPPMPESANIPTPRHYWRTLTYQGYDGKSWWNPSPFAGDVAAGENLIPEIPGEYKVLTQTVTFSVETGDRLYWSGTLLSADLPFQAAWLRKAASSPLLYSNLLAGLASTKSYRAESLELYVDADTLRKSPATYPDWVRDQFLRLPETVPARVHALARDLTIAETTPYDRALAIETYLRTFPYTLEVDQPPPGRDAADYFLFDLKRGYCDYYATAMAVLARAAGVPSRLVVGYANGAYDYRRAQYIVTENYAHSWVEIYFTDIGWVEFEPTATQPAIARGEKTESMTPLVNMTPTESAPTRQVYSFLQNLPAKAWLPVLILFLCGTLWAGFDALRLRRLDPPQTIQTLYRRLRRLARPITGRPPRNQTAYSYAFALTQSVSAFETSPRLRKWLSPSRHEIEKLTDLFSRSLFAPHPSTRTEANIALKNWSRLKWRLILANLLRIIVKRKTRPLDSLTR